MTFGTLLVFVLGIAVIVGLIVWLGRTNTKDRLAMASVLGMSLEDKGPTESGDDPTRARGYRFQQRFLTGTFEGFPATVWQRNFRLSKQTPQKRSSEFTVLSLDLPNSVKSPLLIESKALGDMQAALLGGWETISLGDDSFDRFFRVSSPDPLQTRALVTPALQKQLLALYESSGGSMPHNPAATLSKALLVGTFEVIDSRVNYCVRGTPNPTISESFKRASLALTTLANLVQDLSKRL
jgi:hypothetical protein